MLGYICLSEQLADDRMDQHWMPCHRLTSPSYKLRFFGPPTTSAVFPSERRATKQEPSDVGRQRVVVQIGVRNDIGAKSADGVKKLRFRLCLCEFSASEPSVIQDMI